MFACASAFDAKNGIRGSKWRCLHLTSQFSRTGWQRSKENVNADITCKPGLKYLLNKTYPVCRVASTRSPVWGRGIALSSPGDYGSTRILEGGGGTIDRTGIPLSDRTLDRTSDRTTGYSPEGTLDQRLWGTPPPH